MPDLAKGDAFVILGDFRRKINSAVMKGDEKKAVFFCHVAIEKLLHATFVLNNTIPQPMSRAYAAVASLLKLPAHFDQLFDTALSGQSAKKIAAVRTWLDFCIGTLAPVMKKFPKHYRRWQP